MKNIFKLKAKQQPTKLTETTYYSTRGAETDGSLVAFFFCLTETQP